MPSEPLVWLFLIGGWVVAGYVIVRERTRTRHITALLGLADQAVAEAQALADSVYRVRLSCPACDWTSVVVRETREEALAVGEERISAHNVEAGHSLVGKPKAGYYRGEPLN